MKSSLKILAAFIIGFILGIIKILPRSFTDGEWSEYCLYALILFVGISIGANEKALKALRKPDFRMFIIPAGVIFGTYVGILMFFPIIPGISLREALAVGSGFGYYSLSSAMITRLGGELLGITTLIVNIAREAFTLIFTPLIVRYFGKAAPILTAGATSMDTTLPIITKFCGKEYVLYSLFSGILLTFLVPLIISCLFRI